MVDRFERFLKIYKRYDGSQVFPLRALNDTVESQHLGNSNPSFSESVLVDTKKGVED